MDKFYIGLHQTSDAQHFDRCCIHIARLEGRRKPLGCNEMLIDSQAFRILELHGEHQLSPIEYADRLHRARLLCPEIAGVTQDYMCEQYIFDCRERLTGKRYTVTDHQWLTIQRYMDIRSVLDPSIYLMPVLQGYTPIEYVRHIREYGDLLPEGAWCGVGSVCKRNGSPSQIRDVLYSIKRYRPDLRLHGFGLKRTALSWAWIREALYSADSMAWSFAARKQGRNANDWREADRFVRQIEGRDLSDLPLFQEVA